MGTETPGIADLARRVDELSAQLTSARADIDALLESSARDLPRLDTGDAGAGPHLGLADADRERIKVLEDRAVIDHELLVENRREGVLLEDENRSLHEALQAARAIGAAVGIVMALRGIREVEAFGVLRVASQSQNRTLRLVAEEIVAAGNLSSLPES